MMIEFNKRLVEVDEILNYMSEDDYNKIPIDVIDIIKQNKDSSYVWKFDTTKKLKEQDLPDDTIAILSYINTEYLLNDEQKEFVNNLHKMNDTVIDTNSYKDIFENKQKDTEEIQTTTTEMIIYKENIFKRFFNKIKNIFKNS